MRGNAFWSTPRALPRRIHPSKPSKQYLAVPWRRAQTLGTASARATTSCGEILSVKERRKHLHDRPERSVKLIGLKRLYARRLGAPCANSNNNAEQPLPQFVSVRSEQQVGFIAPPICSTLSDGVGRSLCGTIDLSLRRG